MRIELSEQYFYGYSNILENVRISVTIIGAVFFAKCSAAAGLLFELSAGKGKITTKAVFLSASLTPVYLQCQRLKNSIRLWS